MAKFTYYDPERSLARIAAAERALLNGQLTAKQRTSARMTISTNKRRMREKGDDYRQDLESILTRIKEADQSGAIQHMYAKRQSIIDKAYRDIEAIDKIIAAKQEELQHVNFT
jgi:homogentisate 1,2-dioxygenase